MSDAPTAKGHAPGSPGTGPTWCSSAKQMVGSALGPSRLWFTLGGGIVNEIYHPRIDIPQIRDLGFIIADGNGFWCELKRLEQHELQLPAPGIPAARLVHRHPRFVFTLRVVPDPRRDVLLLDIELEGDESLRPYALLAPHLGGTGHDNVAQVASYRGQRILWAEQGPFGLALAAADRQQHNAWGALSAGYVGRSDGWQDFDSNGAMTWRYAEAGPGNVALTGELPRRATLALGFGSSRESAATLAVSALLQPFDKVWDGYVADWTRWQADGNHYCQLPDDLPDDLKQQFDTSAMVLRVHQDKIYPGAMVASLSVPWGNHRDSRGGYHLVWPRDLVESAGALLALGAEEEAQDVLRYLIATQHDDGHWYQNQWLGGKPFWEGIQLDEAAFPVLLAATLADLGALDGIEVADMVRLALGFIARQGPASDQDRWEMDSGVNTFTLGVCIAALVAGAEFLEPGDRALALALADYWNAHIEDWTTARDTPLARRLGVDAYYMRLGPGPQVRSEQIRDQALPLKNPVASDAIPRDEQVGLEFLQLVRFGLRRADDPLVVASLKVADDLLKVDTPSGASWRRYNGDVYGEHDDGRPYDGSGRGRAWPLLTAERGHYELCAGRDPLPYLQALGNMAGTGGMLPEQIWDAAPIPERFLRPGRPSGSAMPLVWAHAEFVKLTCSRALGQPFDRPRSVGERYGGRRPDPDTVVWCQQAPASHLRAGKRLLIALHQAATVHWGVDGWQQVKNTPTHPTGLGLHVAELEVSGLRPGQSIQLTYREADSGRWRGDDSQLRVED